MFQQTTGKNIAYKPNELTVKPFTNDQTIDNKIYSISDYKNRLILNPDIMELREIIDKIYDNNGYCIIQERTYDTKCPCDLFMKNEICLCRLFVHEEEI